jgi:hypothetical protein
MPRQRAIHAHEDALEYDDFSVDINLVSASPDTRTPARAIFIVDAGSGSIVVTTSGGSANRTYTGLVSGTYLDPSPLYVETIIATGTDVAKVRVGW